MKRLAYIPARGGSKGVPKKNIAEVGGKSLLARAVESAAESGLFARIMVSTDSEEIAEAARAVGAWVPFLRDPAAAQDSSTTLDAVLSDKARLEAMGETFDELVLLQCTSPFRTADDIRGAVELAERVRAGVVSVSPVSEHPLFMRTLGQDGRARRVLDCPSTCRRQDLPPYYRVNGAVYVNFWNELRPGLGFNDNPYGYAMDAARSLDIDGSADLELARRMANMV